MTADPSRRLLGGGRVSPTAPSRIEEARQRASVAKQAAVALAAAGSSTRALGLGD